jgi:NAD(P)-dependent dehydrogenase (short-subunit alcohol dehydrogenase family)
LRAEIAQPHNITVSLICPGPVESEITQHTIRTEGSEPLKESGKMLTPRFSELALRGIYFKFSEMWIADQPFLLVTYIGSYLPWVYRQLNVYVVGAMRVKSMTQGTDLYNVQSMLGLKK